MKIRIAVFLILLSLKISLKAQYVTISDTNFVSYLQANYPSCMTGNQMDTTCTAIQSATSVFVSNSNISDLTGIQYFVNLQQLYAWGNLLTSLPPLPNTLQQLYCSSNQLTALPALPPSLNYMNCYDNQLTSLPALPNTLTELSCSQNMLTSLPTLPIALCSLKCDHNLLTILPAFPSTMVCGLEASDNNITCFPTFPYGLGYIDIANNPFTCLPNYTPGMWSGLLAFPICIEGDTINNPNACPVVEGIVGSAYKDADLSCSFQSWSETGLNHIPFKIYDSINNLIGQTYSYSNGTFQFIEPAGTYRIALDTLNMPFTTQCIYPGIDSLVVLPIANPHVGNVNFDLVCKPGFDVGVQSIVRNGNVFPGLTHTLSVMAGDMSQWYNMACAAPPAGQVEITVLGPVTYVGPASGALTPVVAGSVYTYSIADFGLINNTTAFNLVFTTNVAATLGDTVCVTVNLTPLAGDSNPGNNTATFCYPVVNSFDPNLKEVYPGDVPVGFQDWLTYTVHFQNTGNAPAINIRLADTLDSDLDLSTFQVINYSHFNTSSLMNNGLEFNFPNIQLPDSTSDLEGSKGFVQYRIKPLAGLPAGTTIANTASIYFDYNAPIVTNTTVNEFYSTLSVEVNKPELALSIYPNPNNGKFVVKLSETRDVNIRVYNVLGEMVLNVIPSTQSTQIDLSSQPSGVYFIRVDGQGQSLSRSVIKQ